MPLCHEGKLSLIWYAGTAILIVCLSFPELIFDYVPKIWGSPYWGPVMYYALLNIVIKYKYKHNDYQIVVRAVFLGFVLAMGILITINGIAACKSFGIYACIMSLFHFTEYLAIAWSNPATLSIDSYILNHSVHYLIAAVSSWLEYLVEFIFFPEIKEFKTIWLFGLLMCLGGEVLRKVAMFTANSNFTHVVQFVRQENHKLVKHGVYNYMRHPSYVGWFWWSIGTQIILFNPVCILLYTIVSWKFFHDRIFLEEITLLNFFGKEYQDYQHDVPTGLPFISGYKIDL